MKSPSIPLYQRGTFRYSPLYQRGDRGDFFSVFKFLIIHALESFVHFCGHYFLIPSEHPHYGSQFLAFKDAGQSTINYDSAHNR
jgi:hypothetical protein